VTAEPPRPLTAPSDPQHTLYPGLRGALAVLTLLLTVWLGILVALHARDGRGVAPRAPGLHGSRLPPGVAGSLAFPFELTDARGGRIATAGLRGRPYALTFLYSRCPDVCPLIGQELKGALRDLGSAASRVAVVGVSVDPRGDTAQAVRGWLDRQRQPANFHYAIGTARELSPVWKAFHAAPQLAGRPQTSTHSATVWLVDARGRLRASYAAGVPLRSDEIAGDLRVLLAEGDGRAVRQRVPT
jgi:protein SCO1/2